MDTAVTSKSLDPVLVAEAHRLVMPLTERLLAERTRIKRSTFIMAEFCQGLVELGVPLGRSTIHMRQIHPLLMARSMQWLAESGGAIETGREHGVETSHTYLDSPIRHIYEGGSALRRRLELADCSMDFPILEELKTAGWTDYYMAPLPFSSGPVNAMSFATRRPGGFTEQHIATIEAALPAFAALMEMNHLRRTGRTLLQTYLGPRTGEKVLSGTIKRGDGEVIDAVLWYCDLRDFTALSERLPLDEVIALLNGYFETVAAPVKAHGGEILKFVGDAMLAIFPLGMPGPEGSCGACCTGLHVAEEALAGIAALNQAQAGNGAAPVACGVSLARGKVMYGNVGAHERLDFTVIGPAVNLANRLEDLTRDLALDPPVVFSADVARHCGRPTRSLGRFPLKGIAEPQEAFTFA